MCEPTHTHTLQQLRNACIRHVHVHARTRTHTHTHTQRAQKCATPRTLMTAWRPSTTRTCSTRRCCRAAFPSAKRRSWSRLLSLPPPPTPPVLTLPCPQIVWRTTCCRRRTAPTRLDFFSAWCVLLLAAQSEATAADLRRFYDTHYYPANMHLFVVGDFDPHEMLKVLFHLSRCICPFCVLRAIACVS